MLSFLLFYFTSLISFSQNLVPNPSFEDTVYCPTTPGDIPALIDWYNCGGSPDYYNSCANTSTLVNVPSNWVGYQAAYDGNGYVGIGSLVFGATSVREFMGVQLNLPLILGTKYYASVYLSRTDSFPYVCSSNKFGFRFSTVPYSYTNPAPIDNFSHIHSDSIITDSTGWVKIAGSFVADSAYEYVILGNFYDNANTNTSGICNSSTATYYYTDQVCVSTDSLECNVGVGIVNQNESVNFSIYPNPARNIVSIDFTRFLKPYDLVIYNSLGQMVLSKQIDSSHFTIDVADINDGILLMKILYDNKFFYYKLLKQ